MGIETERTVWEKHLYELAGFKEILGVETVDYLTRGEQIADGRLVNIPYLGIQIRKREPYKPLAKMRPVQIGQNGSIMLLIVQSEDGSFKFRCGLDFAQERLHFDISSDLIAKDDGSAEGAEAMAEVTRFSADYIGNGQLHIVNQETGTLISRKGAFVPVNWFLDTDAANSEMEWWKETARRRRARDQFYGIELERWLSVAYEVDLLLRVPEE